MKVFIATRFTGHEGQHEVERLSKAVRSAGMKDVSFARDVEHYKHTFDNPKEMWERVRDEIAACDTLLIDATDNPTGGRLVEVGMAYALGKMVIVVKLRGEQHKPFFDGIARGVITYHDDDDLAKQLRHFEKDQNFTVTDKSMMLAVFLLGGGFLAYVLAQVWIPLAAIGAVIYWLIVRHFFESMRAFDRVVIYIPLIAIWAGGYVLLSAMNMTFGVAWAIVYWLVVLPLLQLAKFSL